MTQFVKVYLWLNIFDIKDEDDEYARMPVGKYTYQEIKAPANYMIDKKAYPFEIKTDVEIVQAVM